MSLISVTAEIDADEVLDEVTIEELERALIRRRARAGLPDRDPESLEGRLRQLIETGRAELCFGEPAEWIRHATGRSVEVPR
jgi:hypothetical protein